MKGAGAARCLAVWMMMDGDLDRVTAQDIRRMADVLGVTERSVYRYIDTLGRAEFIAKTLLSTH